MTHRRLTWFLLLLLGVSSAYFVPTRAQGSESRTEISTALRAEAGERQELRLAPQAVESRDHAPSVIPSRESNESPARAARAPPSPLI